MVELVGRPDWRVVTDFAVAQQDLVDHLLTVDAVFERAADVHVVERRVVGQHREGVVLVARDFLNAQRRVGAQQRFGLDVDPVDRIHLPGHQGVHTGCVVVDGDIFDLIKEAGAVTLVVIRIACRDQAYARIEGFHLIKPGADTIGDRFFDLACGIHQQVIIRHQIWEVCVARLQRELNLAVGHLLHLGDGCDNRLGSGFRTLSDVQLQRLNHIVSTKGFAIVESHALAQVECPGFGVRRCFPAFRQFTLQQAICAHFG